MNTTSVILVAALALAACTGESPAPALEPPAAEPELPALVRSSVRSDAALAALIHGRLALDADGCIRIESDHGGGAPFVIWHYDSTIERGEDGRIRITDGYTGNAAYVGDHVAMGGGRGSGGRPTRVTPAVPDACANGEYWSAGGLMSEAERQRVLERMRNLTPVPGPE